MPNYSVTGNPGYFNQDVTIAGNLTVGKKIFGTFVGNVTGDTTVSGNVTANKFIVSAGSSTQFLKADGSLDSSLVGTNVSSDNNPYYIVARDSLGGFSAGVGTFTSISVGSAVTANSTGVNVTGVVTATSFVGDGSNLTGISVAQPVTVETFTAPGNWTKPATVVSIKVTVVGGGGNGGNGVNPGAFTANGNGGGGGGTSIKYMPAPTIPSSVAVTAGPGTNSFGSFASATAGGNGAPGTTSNAGGGGIGSLGDINIQGSAGGAPVSATGGSSSLGGGGKISATGGNYGGGGGGGLAPGTAGSAGAPGIVIVEVYG